LGLAVWRNPLCSFISTRVQVRSDISQKLDKTVSQQRRFQLTVRFLFFFFFFFGVGIVFLLRHWRNCVGAPRRIDLPPRLTGDQLFTIIPSSGLFLRDLPEVWPQSPISRARIYWNTSWFAGLEQKQCSRDSICGSPLRRRDLVLVCAVQKDSNRIGWPNT
jgi:hypothetical protein